MSLTSNNASSFDFKDLSGTAVQPDEWLRIWKQKYPTNDYLAYADLISKHRSFSATDFERIGKWKDGVTSESRWRPNIASVAYEIWMQAVRTLPTCPDDDDVATFLNDWANRKYRDTYRNGVVREKRFGVPRAATLLHFLSGGHFPIFDSRVRNAMRKLRGGPLPPNTVDWYLTSYCPMFNEIRAMSGAESERDVDMALFALGMA
jgi:hypothetical protein